MNSGLLRIWLDTERLKYPHTGLYHFCMELGRALVQEKTDREELSFYLPASKMGVFGKEVVYRKQTGLHKYHLPSTDSYQVWHSIHQGSQYFPFRRSIPVVLTIHDLNFLHQPGRGAAYINKSLAKLQQKINRADRVVAISNFVLGELHRNLQVSSVQTSVIYNGCNFSQVAPEKPALIPDKPFLFTIGTLAAKKNFHVLPALLKGNDYWLVIAGIAHEEAYLQKIKQEAVRWGVERRVIITGAITDAQKQWYYQQCAAFVFPSIAEGFGMPVLEAMYFGKPVFLSTYTSLPEIGGSLAYYFTSFDPDEMRRTVEQGLEHYYQTSPQQALKNHALSFSWLAAARQYLSIYRDLA
jgi:glycosyltransferase involved in cell wall biosynthesis